MTSLKIVVFPGLEEITYTTEKKTAAPQSNPVLEFLADRSSVTREELYTIEQLSNKQVEAEKLQRNNKNCRQFVCPPILDLAISSKTKELQPTHKPKRIFNGFFPSKIRTSTSPTSAKDVKYNQELFEELVPESTTSLYHNGTFLGRVGSRGNPKTEPTSRTQSYQQSPMGTSNRDQRVLYSLRNGSPSPWINRYQLKKSSISSCNAKELKNHSMDSMSRGLSR